MAPLCVKDKRKAQAAAAAASLKRSTANGQFRHRGNDHNSAMPGGASAVACNDALCNNSSCCGSGVLSSPCSSPCRSAPVVIERSEIIRLASQYTPCAGCSAAVKGLLQRPIEELRLVNAVVEEAGAEATTGPIAAGGGGVGGGGKSGGGRSKGAGEGRHAGGADEALDGGRRGGCGHGCRHHPSEPPAGHSCPQPAGNSPAGLPRTLSLREAYLTDRARLDQVRC